MNLYPIADPFAAEKLAAVLPALRTYVEDDPRLSRLNFFPGRHLTDTALQREQGIRALRLRLRGQAVTPGVADGLEVSLVQSAGEPRLEIAPGHALAASGEDMVLHRGMTVRIGELSFYDPATQTLSVRLADLETTESADFAAVLVLQPGFVRDTDLPLGAQAADHGTDFTPCERVPEDETFYRTTTADAARLVLCRWPGQPGPGAAWRNRLAWAVFRAERNGQALPWNALGTPLALIGFDAGRRPLWIDRHAVVREGGRPRVRVLRAATGEPRLWEAQFDQFCAELSEQESQQPAAATFLRLPPVGALPRACLELTRNPAAGTLPPFWSASQSFFPSDWAMDVAAAPLEQMDALIAATRSLEPFDLNRRDSVRLLLPVPQEFFDPDLLRIEVPAPEFKTAITRFKERRGQWLAARQDLRNRQTALRLARTGQAPEFPAPDPKQLETPETPVGPLPQPAALFGVTRTGTTFGNAAYTADLLAAFQEDAKGALRAFAPEEIEELKALLKDPDLNTEDRQEIRAYIKQQEQTQSKESGEAAAVGDTAGLEGFIQSLEGRVDEADRLVDSGFLKVRVDVFRLGQLLTNNSLGTQFVASPSLANIIERRTEPAQGGQVNLFASQLLANLAPSAIAGAQPTPGLKSVAPRSARGGTRAPGMALAAGNSWQAAHENLAVIENLLSTQDTTKAFDAVKLAVERADLSADQKAEAQKFVELAGRLDAVTLGQVANVGKFADNYVENFNALSQKQLRAIPLERLQPPLAPKIREEIHGGRLEVFERLSRLTISLAGLTTEFVDRPTQAAGAEAQAPGFLKFHALIARRRLEVLSKVGDDQKTVVDADESRHFASGVKYADMSVAALRAVEKRIEEYRRFLARCREYAARLAQAEAALDILLARAETELDEARSDVAVAQALLREEEARLKMINDRRESILREQVKMVVFHRPRAVDAAQAAPVRRIEPALTEDPVPACLREDLALPSELAAFREVFRDSPAKWFRYAPDWLASVDRWEQLRRLLQRAAARADLDGESPPLLAAGRYQASLQKVMTARRETARKFVAPARRLGQLQFDALSWVDLRREAQESLTLAHLMDAGPAPLARQAAAELDNLFRVATCLYRGFGRVPAIIRLQWAERFSQFDGPADFRNVSRLPRWPQIEFTLRRELQVHVDWLFSRVDPKLSEAVDLINDLVRVALLLASHAPVDQLITGTLLEDAKPVAGGVLRIKVDPLRIRRGMDVVLESAGAGLVRAVVEDIASGFVSARVVAAPAVATTFAREAVVRFQEPRR
jgi:hypothetical protein